MNLLYINSKTCSWLSDHMFNPDSRFFRINSGFSKFFNIFNCNILKDYFFVTVCFRVFRIFIYCYLFWIISEKIWSVFLIFLFFRFFCLFLFIIVLFCFNQRPNISANDSGSNILSLNRDHFWLNDPVKDFSFLGS